MPQSARLSEGGGVQSLFGQCPNRPGIFLSGASLTGNFGNSGNFLKLLDIDQPSEYRLTIYRYAIIVSFSKYR